MSCPIGALQTAANNMRFDVSFYVLGILFVVSALVGRLVCGFLCVFGLIQDLLYRIPVPKLRVPERLDRALRKLKYVVLVLFVLVLPAVLVDGIGLSDPLFCEYVCPAGMVEAALPLLATVESLRSMIGWQIRLESCADARRDRAGHERVPSVLQIPLPARRFLRVVQPVQFAGFAHRRRRLHEVRNLRAHMSYGREDAREHRLGRVRSLRCVQG